MNSTLTFNQNCLDFVHKGFNTICFPSAPVNLRGTTLERYAVPEPHMEFLRLSAWCCEGELIEAAQTLFGAGNCRFVLWIDISVVTMDVTIASATWFDYLGRILEDSGEEDYRFFPKDYVLIDSHPASVKKILADYGHAFAKTHRGKHGRASLTFL